MFEMSKDFIRDEGQSECIFCGNLYVRRMAEKDEDI
jgi:hypothetical protein